MEQEIRLKAYKQQIRVLSLTIDIPTYANDDKRKNYFYSYEDVLTKLFNNKREDKDILQIQNYYDDNRITIRINFTSYMENSGEDEDDVINHLKRWLSSNVDVSNDDIETDINEGYIYTIEAYDNNIIMFKKNNNDFERVYNFVNFEG